MPPASRTAGGGESGLPARGDPAGRPRILVIRRDNIGDLVCTTPLLRALRAQLPESFIVALVNRYNEPVLTRHPDLDALVSYQKAKHREPGETVPGLYWRRLRTLIALRRQRFDWLLLPGGAQASVLRSARLVAPRRLLVRDDGDACAGTHEVEQVCHLLPRMGLEYAAPAPTVVPDPQIVDGVKASVTARLGFAPRTLIGVHISARKPSQRWASERFAALIRQLPTPAGTAFVLLWAPGAESNRLHPGDDGKAAQVLERLRQVPIAPVATRRLEALVAALALCDRVICADGGAMHLAAALSKPIVCLFGDSDPSRWRPWGVPQELLQSASRNVADIMVEDVVQAHQRLCARLPANPVT